MKRVLLFTESLGAGGAEHQLCGLAKMLVKKNYFVMVLTYIEYNFYESSLNATGVEYKCVPKIYNRITGTFVLGKTIKQYKPDTIISFLPGPNTRICITCMFNKVKLIVSERSHTQNWSLGSKYRFLLYKRANHVVANSVSEANNIKAHCYWLREKVISISNFVDTNRFCPKYDNNKGNNTELHIISVGRIISVKNIARYIQALKIVIDQGYDVYADWYGAVVDEKYYLYCMNIIEKLCLNERFRFHNTKTDIEKYYQIADLFCLPSIIEGYPNVVCEAMSCGLPVICSNVCDNPLINENNITGLLFDPCNINEIANSIVKYIRMPQEQKNNMRLLCRERAGILFDKKRYLQQYEQII